MVLTVIVTVPLFGLNAQAHKDRTSDSISTADINLFINSPPDSQVFRGVISLISYIQISARKSCRPIPPEPAADNNLTIALIARKLAIMKMLLAFIIFE